MRSPSRMMVLQLLLRLRLRRSRDDLFAFLQWSRHLALLLSSASLSCTLPRRRQRQWPSCCSPLAHRLHRSASRPRARLSLPLQQLLVRLQERVDCELELQKISLVCVSVPLFLSSLRLPSNGQQSVWLSQAQASSVVLCAGRVCCTEFRPSSAHGSSFLVLVLCGG